MLRWASHRGARPAVLPAHRWPFSVDPLEQFQIRVAADELLHAGACELYRELLGLAAPLAAADDADAERRVPHARPRGEPTTVAVLGLLAVAVVDDRPIASGVRCGRAIPRRNAAHGLRRGEKRPYQRFRHLVEEP